LNISATARFDRVLTHSERAAAVRALDSVGAKVASWATSRSGRTYALLEIANDASIDSIRAAIEARIDAPPSVVLDVVPRDRDRVDALTKALSGAGAPAGVNDVRSSGDALTLELDDAVTPLRLIVDVIDAELEPSPGRQIVPLFPLSDATATAFAAATLRAPEIDVTRLLETYSEPLLRSGA
jgi:hypothetical protein